MTLSRGGLQPPQHQVEYKSLLIIEFVSLIAAEAGDLRYYIIYPYSATSLTGMARYRPLFFPDEPDTNR